MGTQLLLELGPVGEAYLTELHHVLGAEETLEESALQQAQERRFADLATFT